MLLNGLVKSLLRANFWMCIPSFNWPRKGSSKLEENPTNREAWGAVPCSWTFQDIHKACSNFSLDFWYSTVFVLLIFWNCYWFGILFWSIFSFLPLPQGYTHGCTRGEGERGSWPQTYLASIAITGGFSLLPELEVAGPTPQPENGDWAGRLPHFFKGCLQLHCYWYIPIRNNNKNTLSWWGRKWSPWQPSLIAVQKSASLPAIFWLRGWFLLPPIPAMGRNPHRGTASMVCLGTVWFFSHLKFKGSWVEGRSTQPSALSHWPETAYVGYNFDSVYWMRIPIKYFNPFKPLLGGKSHREILDVLKASSA